MAQLDNQNRKSGHYLVLVAVALTAATLVGPSVHAKKARPVAATPDTSADQPPAGGGDPTQQAQMAELQATMCLAQVMVGRVALAEEPVAADVRTKLGDIYDREETTAKDGLSKLHAAKGDAGKVSTAAGVIQSAPTEARRYLAANPTISDALARRGKIINTELGQIAKTPNTYLATLKSIGVGEPAYSQAKTVVQAAATQSGGRTDGDSGPTLTAARSQVRAMLSARQIKALDASLAGG